MEFWFIYFLNWILIFFNFLLIDVGMFVGRKVGLGRGNLGNEKFFIRDFWKGFFYGEILSMVYFVNNSFLYLGNG